MDKSTNQITDAQIKVLEEMRESIEEEAKYFFWQPNKDKAAEQSAALTALLTELCDTREMLEAANSIGFQSDFLTRISPDTWVMHSDDEANNGVQFNSALAAWREGVKGEKDDTNV